MVMDRTAEAFHVVLDGRTVAHLFQQGDFTWLEWQQGYWQDPHRPILGLRFENEPEGRIASALKLPPWFSNLLPEGQLRDWVARSAGVSSQREIMLLRRLGRDLPGGVMIEAVQGLVNPKWEPDEFVVQQGRGAVEIAQRPRFSLAGVALKFSMVQRGERLTLPSHLEDGNWIVKLPDSTYSNVPQNEFATMALARSLGITTPRFRLLERDELPPLPENVWPNGQSMAYAIERFDRRPGGRIHMEDLAQVKGVYPHNKYEGSFETAAALVYRGMDFESGLEFVRRLFFSFMVGNGDMHLKNTTLLYSDPRRPTISPAYDLVCTAP